MIYNDLGLQFTSPTINLWFHENQFLKFAINFEKYRDTKLEFVPNERGKYPKGRIEDVDIYFLHYKTEEEAERKWTERYRRADMENIFVLLNDMELEKEDYELLRTLHCKRKLVFTTNPDHADWDDFFYIDMYEPNSYPRRHTTKKKNGHYDFELFFDFAEWLNGGSNFHIKSF